MREAAGSVAVVAHRGAHTGLGAPVENSLGAFRRAIGMGVDRIELDVHATRDGVLVVSHDPTLVDGRRIVDLDLAQLPPLHDGQPMPTLDAVLELTRSRDAQAVVEIKQPGTELATLRAADAVLRRDQFEIISFEPASIAVIEAIAPGVTTGVLGPRIPEWLRTSALFPAAAWVVQRLGVHPTLDRAARLGADYVSVEHRMATPGFLSAAQHRGIPVDVWDANATADLERFIADGRVRSLVTDEPALALQLRDGVAVA